MAQKILRIGNSAGVLIPKSVLEEGGLKIGASINVAFNKNLGNVVIEVPKKYISTNTVIDKEVYAVANDLLKRYLPAFKKLAKPNHD